MHSMTYWTRRGLLSYKSRPDPNPDPNPCTMESHLCPEKLPIWSEESQRLKSPKVRRRLRQIAKLRQLRFLLVPITPSRSKQKHFLGLTLDEAKEWMRQQADDWDKDAWEQEDENRWEALQNREATLKHFDGYSDLVGKLWCLDHKGQTRELWERLVKECPPALLDAGLMPDKPTDEPPLAPPLSDQMTRWDRLKSWAFNNWLVVGVLAVVAVLTVLVTLLSQLETLINWVQRFFVLL